MWVLTLTLTVVAKKWIVVATLKRQQFGPGAGPGIPDGSGQKLRGQAKPHKNKL